MGRQSFPQGRSLRRRARAASSHRAAALVKSQNGDVLYGSFRALPALARAARPTPRREIFFKMPRAAVYLALGRSTIGCS
jgi:hypothetical protein